MKMVSFRRRANCANIRVRRHWACLCESRPYLRLVFGVGDFVCADAFCRVLFSEQKNDGREGPRMAALVAPTENRRQKTEGPTKTRTTTNGTNYTNPKRFY